MLCSYKTNQNCRSRSSHHKCCIKNMFLEISENSQENSCVRVFFLIKLQASIKKESLVHVFSCECYEISKNTFFIEHLWTTASVGLWFKYISTNLYVLFLLFVIVFVLWSHYPIQSFKKLENSVNKIRKRRNKNE